MLATPPRPRPRLPPHHSPATTAHDAPFTAAQRSAQARGKPFANTPTNANTHTNSARSLSSSLRAGTRGGGPVLEAESYAQREARNEAAAILDSEEMLMWYAAARYESVSQTRRFFRNVVMGVGGEEVVWREEWESGGRGEGSPRVGKGKGRERERERTPRKRVSNVGGGGGNGGGSGSVGGGGPGAG